MSKEGGGIGLDVNPMRGEGAIVSSTGWPTDGIIPYIRYIESMKRFARQGRRKGACAVYNTFWHTDIVSFLLAAREKGVDERRNAPDLKYGMWTSDLFMKVFIKELAEMLKGTKLSGIWEEILNEGEKVLVDDEIGDWYLMCPNECPLLNESYGEEFNAIYRHYVECGKYKSKVKASTLFTEWYDTVRRKGNPYMLFGDNINNTSNLAHVHKDKEKKGKITHSNLCAEITIPSYCDENNLDLTEIGVCMLSAIPLASFVIPDARTDSGVRMDWQGIYDTCRISIRALDRSIDINHYPVEPCRRSSHNHRPVGLGIMGLADVFAMFKYKYGSPEAMSLDQAISSVIFYASKSESSDLGRKYGNFPSFEGSWSQRGYLHPDVFVERGKLDPDWEMKVEESTDGFLTPEMWSELRESCSKFLRNGYVTAYMPTATSANVVGQNTCFEPFGYIMWTKRTQVGVNVIFNKHFLKELEELGLWTDEMRRLIIDGDGSIQHLEQIPQDIRDRFKTAREIDQRALTYHASKRAPFCEQAMSLNYYWNRPTMIDVATVQVLGWYLGNPTGSYYNHSQAGATSQKTSIIKTDGTGISTDNDTKSLFLDTAASSQKKFSKNKFVCNEEVCTACEV